MFKNCEARTLIDLLECMAAKVYLPKEYILLEGSKGRHMYPPSRSLISLAGAKTSLCRANRYILLRGLCEILSGETRLKLLADGSFFGEQVRLSACCAAGCAREGVRSMCAAGNSRLIAPIRSQSSLLPSASVSLHSPELVPPPSLASRLSPQFCPS
jgi:hypothetical protein